MTRSLTTAEASVIATLLAARPERERERLRQVGVPRSTYYAIRRRAYLEGWLRDRYIPDPSRLGRPIGTFVLGQPYADRLPELAREPPGSEAVMTSLWASPQLALAVLFDRDGSGSRAIVARWEEQKLLASSTVVSVDVRGPTVPVFFDYEGMWSHMVQLPGTLAYPHGLGGSMEDGDGSITPHSLWAFRNLLGRPFAVHPEGHDGHLTGPFGLPFSERRILAKGWATHRVLLEPSRVPPYGRRAGSQLVIVHGTPRPGARPEALFSRLTHECRAFPILYTVGKDRWLLGALGGDPLPTDEPDDRRSRPPLLPLLTEFLEAIRVLREPVGSMAVLVDHRYDRLVSPTGGTSTRRPAPGGG
ncbi:MAG: hypothetical protein QXG65_02395 [Thermoplasmata archaeon]